MIRIKRSPIPLLFLTEKIKSAKQNLINQFENKNSQEKMTFSLNLYDKQSIYNALSREFSHKCVYCENTITKGQDSFEHFRPKGGAIDFDNKFFPNHYFWLAYEWSNIYLSCRECNASKANWFPIEGNRAEFMINPDEVEKSIRAEINLIIDPCYDEPEKEFSYLENGEIFSDSRKGKVTIELLKLNRPALVEERKNAFLDFKQILALLKTSKKNNKQFLITATTNIEKLLSDKPSESFVGMKRYFFKEWLKENTQLWTKIKDIKTPNIDKLEGLNLNVQTKSSQKEILKTTKQLERLKRIDIEKIIIENFKCIENLTLELSTIQPENTQPWLLILGDNGVGKSTILQAIALATIGQKQIEKLGINGRELLRHGTKKGYIEIFQKGVSNPIRLDFSKRDITSNSVEPVTYVTGFGSTRLLPKGRYFRPERFTSPYVRIKNLFDYTTSLIDANKWLIELSDSDFDRVSTSLKEILMLGNQDMLIRKLGKILINKNGSLCTLDEMSDGYKSVIALTVDIMSTLSKNQAHFDIIEGIVLIDEIGNHLHPRWKMKIVTCLKTAFKSMQFIVTTHEPLCLQGMKFGEVVVLHRNAEHKLFVLDSKVLPDHTFLHVDQLLTSDFFGLLNTLDIAAEDDFQRYYYLLSKKERTSKEEEEKESLRVKINAKEQIGKTEREDALLKAYDEVLANKLVDNNIVPKEIIKKEAIEVMKKTIKKTFDWL
jgi:uncharacterized protein (TIGR02646 family)